MILHDCDLISPIALIRKILFGYSKTWKKKLLSSLHYSSPLHSLALLNIKKKNTLLKNSIKNGKHSLVPKSHHHLNKMPTGSKFLRKISKPSMNTMPNPTKPTKWASPASPDSPRNNSKKSISPPSNQTLNSSHKSPFLPLNSPLIGSPWKPLAQSKTKDNADPAGHSQQLEHFKESPTSSTNNKVNIPPKNLLTVHLPLETMDASVEP